MSFVGNAISRKHEYEADEFAKSAIGSGEHLINGLKKLTVTNLGNLTPHIITVWLNYSHPPVLSRIKALMSDNPWFIIEFIWFYIGFLLVFYFLKFSAQRKRRSSVW